MTRLFIPLLIKFSFITVVAFAALTLYGGMDWRWAMTAALDVTLISYLLGDLIIYRRYGNLPGLLSDALIAFVVVYSIDIILIEGTVNIWAFALFAVLVAFVEFFFHKYVEKTGLLAG